jgi:hypothetical protein
MAQLSPQPHHLLDRWLRRLDRAADGINPFLTVVAIGLGVLNLTYLVLLASQLPITHGMPGISACPQSSVSAEASGDQRGWTLY